MTDDPLWYKDAIIYQMHVKAFHRRQWRRHRRFRRPGAAARLHPGAGRQHDLAAAVLSVAAARRRLRHRDYTNVHPDYGTLDDFRQFVARRIGAG
jgi:maltose alpha-D-glucosyltransferase/alpha-amylase